MWKRIDESRFLSRFLEGLSNTLAKQRGLPVIIGIILVVISFIVQAVNVYANSQTLELIGVVVQHLGLLLALVGLLLAEALGE
jgi:vacuolar-type H+-ATPase subunit I/STV1